jgi:hypothetical protein
MHWISRKKLHVPTLCFISALISCTTPAQKGNGVQSDSILATTKNKTRTSSCQLPLVPIPSFMKSQSIMVTRFLKSCTLETGGTGFQENSPFVAMGFPCAGGEGKMEVVGYYYNPKSVRFILDTACPMLRTSQEKIRNAVREALKLTSKASLLAINPFAVQYWEIPGFEAADVGATLDLPAIETQVKRWNPVTKGHPIEVRLYGRENAWIQDNVVYEVQGELLVVSQSRFQLRVKQAKAMTKEEEKKVLARCKALEPARECSQVFTGGA